MTIRIDIEPCGEGWKLHSDALEQDVFFQSGRQAEEKAFEHVTRLARRGCDAELTITLRDGYVAARRTFGEASAAC